MARAEMRDSGAGNGAASGAQGDGDEAVATGQVAAKKDEHRPKRFPSSRVAPEERERLLRNARDVDFPIALRGYERTAVDRYVEQLNRLIAELEMSSSPESAVRHALDEVSEETRDLLQRAHATAEEITARSRAKADDRLQLAEREAQELREAARREAQELREAARSETEQLREEATREAHALRDAAQHESTELRQVATQEVTQLREAAARDTQELRSAAQQEADEVRGGARRDADQMLEAAEARARELGRNAEAIWRERRRLLNDMQTVADQLTAIGEAEAKRFSVLPAEVSLGEPAATAAGEAADAEPTASPEAVEPPV
jgi:cell division septum initiation protein DivIVA